MSITSALVLYVVIWAVVLFMILPQWQTSQIEDGEITPGSPASAPTDAMIKKKLIVTTVIATCVYAVIFSIIFFRLITLDDIPFLNPPASY